ncbi:MAG: hypothetical protein LBG76_01210 [Treponema sp.]|jgi:hypothetical protein|nr:hypothetical protein [Treponema sp.]
MPDYSGIQKEETLKGLVRDDYFSKFSYEPNIDNIDFVITDKKTRGGGMDAAVRRQARETGLLESYDVSEGNSKTPSRKSATDGGFSEGGSSSRHYLWAEAKIYR